MSISTEVRQTPARRKNRLFFNFLLLLILTAAVALSVFGYMYYENYTKMKAAVLVDNIYPNIFINGVAVGGISKSEAKAKLEEKFLQPLLAKQIEVSYENASTGKMEQSSYSFKDFSASLDFSAAIDEAYLYARIGSIKERYDLITALNLTPLEINVEPKYTFDADGPKGLITKLESKVYLAPVNATIDRKQGQFITTKEKSGRKLDVEATTDKVLELLVNKSGGTVIAEYNIIRPEYFEEDFEKAKNLIGGFFTTFVEGDAGRTENIKTAISKINDIVVYPEEIFSTNNAFGPSTYENGYRPAAVIINGKFVDDIGGGVCQVSSTLYNAALYAELEIVERQNHSLKVGYLDYGYDATLAGNYIDLKFKNTTPYPIFIESFIDSSQSPKKIIVNIYGYELHTNERTLEFKSELVEKIEPGEAKITEDPMLPLGQKIVDTQPKIGYKYNLYKYVFNNGVQVEKVLVNRSYYRPVVSEVRVGTMEPEYQATAN